MIVISPFSIKQVIICGHINCFGNSFYVKAQSPWIDKKTSFMRHLPQ